MRKAIGVGCLTVGVWWLGAGVAAAGIYDVHGCRLPNGKLIATDGWQPYTQYPGTTANGCAQGGGLYGTVDVSKVVSKGAMGGWVFEAPPDTTIENYTLHRTSASSSGIGDHGRNAWLYHDATIWDGIMPSRYAQGACPAVLGCHRQGDPRSPFAAANREQRSGVRILRLFYVSQCDGPVHCQPAEAANVTVWASRIGITDPHDPAFERDPSAALLRTGPIIDGEHAVTFTATDRGSGIASVALVVDGQLLEQVPALATATACRRPYVATVPCPRRIERTVMIDTTRIANGRHTVQVALTDAAGNRTLSAPTPVEVRNRGLPNGTGATQFARLEAWFASRGNARRTSTVVRYGTSRVITGRLVSPEETPIVGAELDVAATTTRPGSHARVVDQVVTDANGAFRFSPPAGSSRRFSVSYRAFTLDAAPVAIADVSLQTRAGVRLAVSPKRVAANGKVRFHGRLRGGPGRGGTQVVIYALGGARSRIPVATVRANSQGRFSYRYRFRNSSPGTTYRFRATLHAQRSYPYATGSSRPVTLRIR